jgi:hypothetical protein
MTRRGQFRATFDSTAKRHSSVGGLIYDSTLTVIGFVVAVPLYERSRGSVVTVAWLATSNATQRPLLHSSASP